MPLDHGEIRFPHRELRVLSAPTVLDSCAYLSVIEAGLYALIVKVRENL